MKNLYDLRVVKILNDTDVVVNAGLVDDVSIHMSFLVYNLGDEIVDKQTGEQLGQLELVRGTIDVLHLQDRMFIGRSNQTELVRTVGVGILSATGSSERRVLRKLFGAQEGDLVRRIS
jgi:hypothetical protein